MRLGLNKPIKTFSNKFTCGPTQSAIIEETGIAIAGRDRNEAKQLCL